MKDFEKDFENGSVSHALAARHADDFGIGRAAVPESEQHQVGTLKEKFVGPLGTIVEDILVKQEA